MKFFTQSYSSPASPLVIVKGQGVFDISVLATGGAITILGTGTFMQVASAPITLNDGESWTKITSLAEGDMELTITPVTGTANVSIGFSG